MTPKKMFTGQTARFDLLPLSFKQGNIITNFDFYQFIEADNMERASIF